MSYRDFSKQPGFGPYTYEDRETGESMTSPFPAAVVGVDDEVLGVGRVIGAITDDDWDGMPVIAIEDTTAEGGTVEILGIECFWTPGMDAEIAEVLSRDKASEHIVRASVYVQMLEADNN